MSNIGFLNGLVETPPLGVFTNFQIITDNRAVVDAIPGTLYIHSPATAATAITFVLPSSSPLGVPIGIVRGTSTGTITTTAPSGATINGGSSGGSIAISSTGAHAGQSVGLIATSSTTWVAFTSAGTDYGSNYVASSVITTGNNTSLAATTLTSGLFWTRTAINSTTSTVTTKNWYAAISGTFTLTLTISANNQIIWVTNEGSGVVTVAASSGSLVGPTTLGPNAGAIYLCDATNWRCLGSWGTPANTGNSAVVSTPSLSSTASQISTTADVMLYLDITLAGTLTFAYGPTSTPANTIYSAVAVSTATAFPSIRVPAGWYVAVTTVTATFTATAVTC